MTTATKIGPKYQVTIPQAVRKAVGLEVGDLVTASVGPNGTVVLHPQLIIEKVDWESLPPSIKKRLKQALADKKAGRVSRPSTNAKDFVRSLRGGKK